MKIQTIQDNLEAVLNVKTGKKVAETLAKFEGDPWLLDTIDKYSNPSRNGLTDSTLTSLINIIDGVVSKDYRIANPKMMSPIYMQVIENQRTVSYDVVIAHVSEVAEQVGDAITYQVNPQAPRAKDSISNGVTPFIYGSGSYLSLVKYLFEKTTADSTLKPHLECLEYHFGDLNDKDVDPEKLIKSGYVEVLIKLAEKKKKDNNVFDSFDKELKQLSHVLERMDHAGFEVYQKQTMEMLGNYVANGSLPTLDKATEYLNRNALILYFDLRLKNEDTPEPALVERASK